MNLGNLTPQQKAVSETDQIWDSLALTIKAALNDVNDRVVRTGNPQDYFDVLGTNAKEALEVHQAAVLLCRKLGGTPITLPENSLTVNEDGSVTFSTTES